MSRPVAIWPRSLGLCGLILITSSCLTTQEDARPTASAGSSISDPGWHCVYAIARGVENSWACGDQRICFGSWLRHADSQTCYIWGMQDPWVGIRATTKADEIFDMDLKRFTRIAIPGLSEHDLESARWDPHSSQRKLLDYVGHPESQWYLIRSVGPDGDADLDLSRLDPRPIYQYQARRGLDQELPSYQYDPTNGTLSSGDILFWRDARVRGEGAARRALLSRAPFSKPDFDQTDLN